MLFRHCARFAGHLEFSAFNDVHPMIEKYPLSRVTEAYEQMHSGKSVSASCSPWNEELTINK
jgi:D-arabinose 1-dehydrogenase-like Zn-dependent alcohol dehydrogenase